jgi:hypothetical protein
MRETFEQLSSSKEYAKVQGSILKKTSWDILIHLEMSLRTACPAQVLRTNPGGDWSWQIWTRLRWSDRPCKK